MIAVDMEEGRLFHDAEIKDRLAAAQPFGEWVEKVVDLNALLRDVPEKALFAGEELRRRQIAAGYSVEELEQVLAPMAEDGKEMVASHGRRHARRRALGAVPAALALLPPELLPGDQPAHRLACARAG